MAPFAFLSSTAGPVSDYRRRVRRAIHDIELPEDRHVWVDEVDDGTKPGTYEGVEALFDIIRDSSVIIVLLFGDSHGTGVTFGSEGRSHVSFWEAEVFYACLRRKPIYVFMMDDFANSGKLAGMLGVLRDALPSTSWIGPHSERTIVAAVRQVLWREARRHDLTSGRALIGRLVDGLLWARGRDGHGGKAERETLDFTDGRIYDSSVTTNSALVARLLADVRAQKNEEGRLTRLWFVYRELCGAPYDRDDFTDHLPDWNDFFGEWASAGSWYGLHGHLHAAALSAMIKQAQVRERMRGRGRSSWPVTSTAYPGGSVASARYSIARKARSAPARRFLLEAAMRDVERSIAEGVLPMDGLLAMRGSIYRQFGQVRDAVADYHAVVRIRESAGASPALLGDALSELGFGYLRQGRPFRAHSFLKEGVALLERSDARPGFVSRAKKKLALSELATGKPIRALWTWREAARHARDHGALDQL